MKHMFSSTKVVLIALSVAVILMLFYGSPRKTANANGSAASQSPAAKSTIQLYEFGGFYIIPISGGHFKVGAHRKINSTGTKEYIRLSDSDGAYSDIPAENCREWINTYKRIKQRSFRQDSVIKSAILILDGNDEYDIHYSVETGQWNLRRASFLGRLPITVDPITQLYPEIQKALNDLEAMRKIKPSVALE